MIGYSNSGYPLLFTSSQFAHKNVVIFAGLNELKSSSSALLSHCFSIYQNTYSPRCRWLASGGYLPRRFAAG